VIGNTGPPQFCRNFFDVFAGCAIDDAGLVLANDLADPVKLGRFPFDAADREMEIVPRKSRNKNLRLRPAGLAERELFDDVGADFLRGGCREGDDLRLAQFLERPL